MEAGWIAAITTLFLAGIGGVVWLIRLESEVKFLKAVLKAHEKASGERIEKLEVKHDNLQNKIFDKLSLIEKCLSNIEGRLANDKQK